MSETKGKGFRSRKFLCAMIGAILPVVNQIFGLHLPVEAILTTLVSLTSYIVGESVIDAQRAKAAAG